jgi:hypothetical protein
MIPDRIAQESHGGIGMKRTITVALIVLALLVALAACTKNDKLLVTRVAPSTQADPHAGIGGAAIPAGVGHKGKVVDVLNAGGYTYIQIDENGRKLWVAVMSASVSKGDEIEFPDAPLFTNFHSKILDRSFDSLIFAAGIRNNGRK